MSSFISFQELPGIIMIIYVDVARLEKCFLNLMSKKQLIKLVNPRQWRYNNYNIEISLTDLECLSEKLSRQVKYLGYEEIDKGESYTNVYRSILSDLLLLIEEVKYG